MHRPPHATAMHHAARRTRVQRRPDHLVWFALAGMFLAALAAPAAGQSDTAVDERDAPPANTQGQDETPTSAPSNGTTTDAANEVERAGETSASDDVEQGKAQQTTDRPDYWTHTFDVRSGTLGLLGGVLLIALAFFARSTLLRRLRRVVLDEAESSRWKDALAQATARIGFVGFIAAGVLLMGYYLTDYFAAVLQPDLVPWRDHAFDVLLYLALLYVAFELIGPVGAYVQSLASRTETDLDDQLARFATYALRAVVIVIGVFLLFDLIGAPFIALVVGLAIVSVLLLLVGYDAVRDISSSFQLLGDPPFRVGDVIRVGEIVGAVRRIGLRAAELETPQRTRVLVPNHELARRPVENLSSRTSRRVEFHLDLARQTPPLTIIQLCDAVREVLLGEPAVGREHQRLEPETGEGERDPSTDESLRSGVDPLVVLAGIEPHGFRVQVRYDLTVVEFAESARIQEGLLLEMLELLAEYEVELVGPAGSTREVGALLVQAGAAAGDGAATAAPPAKKAAAGKAKKKKSSAKKKSPAKKKSTAAAQGKHDGDTASTSVSQTNGSGS